MAPPEIVQVPANDVTHWVHVYWPYLVAIASLLVFVGLLIVFIWLLHQKSRRKALERPKETVDVRPINQKMCSLFPATHAILHYPAPIQPVYTRASNATLPSGSSASIHSTPRTASQQGTPSLGTPSFGRPTHLHGSLSTLSLVCSTPPPPPADS